MSALHRFTSRCASAPWLLMLGALLFCTQVHAHKQSDSYLNLSAASGSREFSGQWDIALRDLEFAIGLDANADDRITWSEVKAQRAAIERYAFDHLALTAIAGDEQGACTTQPQDLLIDQHVDGAYAVLKFAAACPFVASTLSVNYTLLFAEDPNHRGLLDLRMGDNNRAAVLAKSSAVQTFDSRGSGFWQQFRAFAKDGVWHIWTGYDHLLFLFTLLLPAVLIYRNDAWQPQESLRNSALDIVKVVTAFTLSHSLTLLLGTLGFIHLPSRLVETAIALTVLLGALNLIWPVVRERRWLVAFVFGLVHGLGFASLLGDLELQGGALLGALFAFNVGVEAGQLTIVAIAMPLIYMIRESMFYRRILLPTGATTIGCLAAYWVAIRSFPTFFGVG